MNFVNKNQIKEAYISEPYENSGEPFGIYPSHGWQLGLIMEYCINGYHHKIIIDCADKQECENRSKELGLTLN